MALDSNDPTVFTGLENSGALAQTGNITGAARSGLGRPVQELTVSGAITLTSGIVILNHISGAIAATLAAPTAGDELFIVDYAASGTPSHTVKTAAGVTFDGTNNTATFNAVGEALHIVALSATRWFIMENISSVGLSST